MILPINSNNLVADIGNQNRSIVIIPTDGSHKAYLTSRIYKTKKMPVVVVLKDAQSASGFMEELKFFLPEDKHQIVFFPEYPILPFKSLSYHRDISIKRLAALSRIMNAQHPLLILTTVDTLLQKMIPKTGLEDFAELVMVNEELDRDGLILKLESGGYLRTSLVEDPGEYSVRGGILDIYAPGHAHPVRIEFFGDLVESIRYFSPYTQRGFKDIFEFVIVPANEAVLTQKELPHILARLREAGTSAGLDAPKIREYVNQIRESGRFPGIESMLSIVYERPDTLFDYIPPKSFWILDNPDELGSFANEFENRADLYYKTAMAEKRICVEPRSIHLKWDRIQSDISSNQHTAFHQFQISQSPYGDETPVFLFEYQDNLALSSQLKREGFKDNPLLPLAEWFKHHGAGQA